MTRGLALDSSETPGQRTCARLVRDARRGDTPTRADLSPAACGADPVAALGYDPHTRLAGFTRDVAAGDVIVAPPGSALADLPRGQALRLRVAVGAVIIEREVQTLQPARRGEPLFVRTQEGDVLVAPFPELAP